MKKIIFYLFILCIQTALMGQKITDTEEQLKATKMPKELRMPYFIYKICKDALVTKTPINFNQSNLTPREDGRVKLEVVNRGSKNTIETDLLVKIGFNVSDIYENRCNVWLLPEEILPLVQKLPKQYFLEYNRPYHSNKLNEGPLLTHSDTYSSTAGRGIRVAIFDSRFSRYESARRNRQVRFPVAYYNHGHGTLQEGNEVHGTACTETVFDHVPQAEYYLHKIETLTDLGSAVRQCKTDNVRIISHSLSWFRTGWGDNSGGACAAANDAARNNILFFTSSGNYNDKNHYQANRLNGSNFHNWGNGDELNNFSLAPNATVKIHLQWADGPDFLNDDYDLFLYDLSNGTPRQIASSQNANDFEYIDYKNNGQNVMSLGLAVKQDGNDNNPFEIFAYSDDEKSKLEYYSNSNNTPSPANATEANVIVVGAVERTDYNSPTGSNNITNYSSVGPTNDGKLNLDIVAPTATSTISYINTDTNPNGYFGGTSCATPNAAGTVAAFWSEHPNMTANNIREITFRMAQLYNDWGTLGLDNIYGNGGIRLYDFAPNTQFVYSHSLAQFPFLEPYPHPRSADTYAPVGSNIVLLAQNYNVLSVPVKLNKKMIYRSAVKASSIR